MRNVTTQDLRQERVTEGSESVLGQKRKEAKKERIRRVRGVERVVGLEMQENSVRLKVTRRLLSVVLSQLICLVPPFKDFQENPFESSLSHLLSECPHPSLRV